MSEGGREGGREEGREREGGRECVCYCDIEIVYLPLSLIPRPIQSHGLE